MSTRQIPHRLLKNSSILASQGLPVSVVTDNGAVFTSVEFQEFMENNGIKHIKAAYHPASNGQVERVVQVLKEGMK